MRRASLSMVLVFCIFLGGSLSPLAAQLRTGTEITIEGSRGIPVHVDSIAGPSGSEAAEILRRSLIRDGQFRLLERATGAFLIQGRLDSERLSGTLLDPAGKRLLRQSYHGASPAHLAREFSDDIVASLTGSRGIASSRIGFVSDRSGHKEIYVCDSDGGSILQITRDQSISVSPCLSPDGKKLAYTGYFQGFPDVYLIDLTSGRRHQVFAEAGTNTGAAISPVGDRVALTMSHPGNPELFVAPAKGGLARRLTRNGAVESSPSWSPDGKQIVYVSDSGGRPQLYIVASSGGQPSRLETGFRDCFEPHWSPDGTRIVFTFREGGAHHIAILDLPKRSVQKLPHSAGAEQPVWGANSRHLIYLQNQSIYLHDTGSGARESILSRFGNLSELTWTR